MHSPKCSSWVQSQKWQNDLSLFTRQTIQNHNNPILCTNHWCWRSWSWPALWRPATPFRTNTKIRCPFHHRVLECKSRKSRDTWNNRQVWPCSTKWSRAKANRVLSRHNKHPLLNTQEMTLHMDIIRWSVLKSDWSYSLQLKMKKLYDCDSDHELLIAKFRLKLKKAGKTTRPFKYDLNQIPYIITQWKWKTDSRD